jgi:hypothetical protein
MDFSQILQSHIKSFLRIPLNLYSPNLSPWSSFTMLLKKLAAFKILRNNFLRNVSGKLFRLIIIGALTF